jgi:hypothetical protein
MCVQCHKIQGVACTSALIYKKQNISLIYTSRNIKVKNQKFLVSHTVKNIKRKNLYLWNHEGYSENFNRSVFFLF